MRKSLFNCDRPSQKARVNLEDHWHTPGASCKEVDLPGLIGSPYVVRENGSQPEFPDVDLHWLVTGEQKIEKEKENIVMEEPDNYESGFKEKYLKMLEENRELRIQKESLQKSIDSLKKSDKQILDKS